MMAVWLGGERGCLSVSVSESMTAICQFHGQFSEQCVALCINLALLYARHTTPLNCENITKTDIRVKHSTPTPLQSVVADRFVHPNSVVWTPDEFIRFPFSFDSFLAAPEGNIRPFKS